LDTYQLLKLIAPEAILKSFDLSEIKETEQRYEIYFIEKEDLVPLALQGKESVLDGYCNPLTLYSFPIKATPTLLVLKRRRWKPKGGGDHYFNEYEFNPPHVKATKEFAAFLKEVFGHTLDQYLSLCGINGDRS
jgi:hypothetical protein